MEFIADEIKHFLVEVNRKNFGEGICLEQRNSTEAEKLKQKFVRYRLKLFGKDYREIEIQRIDNKDYLEKIRRYYDS